ncbi:SGNH/GDSL hydrolase family protein [Nonomuraea sp. NN258]|uniref:SGNH/GDSL hydrolase family protein n=1 Tax=Nonomuraea antri TaxID=2730852 RepID=UPI001567FE23|nr:SGNH/GDSL hydrolase family protein [Nonomuraea antri]NRQ33174.1 SGNH/GDSL hydrolase family protein [Nonomuraea antri]
MAVPPSAPPPPAGEPAAPVMMFVGDSFTVGSGPVPRWRTYATQAARLLGGQPIIAGAGGTGYLNEGRSGRTFLRSFEAELSWRPAPDLLVLSGGHNDHRWSAARVGRAASELVGRIKARWPRTRIVMVGPIWLGDPPGKAYRMRDALAAAAGSRGVPFLDPLQRRWSADSMLPDGVHPTLTGHERLGAWLAGALRGVYQGP